jgi:hypothetical protein
VPDENAGRHIEDTIIGVEFLDCRTTAGGVPDALDKFAGGLRATHPHFVYTPHGEPQATVAWMLSSFAATRSQRSMFSLIQCSHDNRVLSLGFDHEDVAVVIRRIHRTPCCHSFSCGVIGLTEHIGVTRGLIEPRMHLETWKAKLMARTRRARWRLCRGFAAGSQRRIGGENL